MKTCVHLLFNRSALPLAITAVMLVTTSIHAQSPAASPTPTGKEAALTDAEQSYLQSVVKANLGEIAMSYLAIEKSASNHVKSYASSVIDTHTKTIKELMEIASKHDAFLKLEPDLSASTKLESHGGDDFDKLYAAEAQRINREAIDSLNPLVGGFKADDVKDFAKEDLKDDKNHLKEAQDLAAKLEKGDKD